MSSGVYAIRNVRDGKVYVGQTTSFDRRFSEHRTDLNAHIHHCPHLQNAWSKYGARCFIFEILEQVPDPGHLLERELTWMSLFPRDRLYNAAIGPHQSSLLTRAKVPDKVAAKSTYGWGTIVASLPSRPRPARWRRWSDQ